MKLSEHLTLAEMIRSESAKRLGISNQPTSEHLDNMKILAENIFEPIRRNFDTPIYVSSGYRSEALNKALKNASKTSQHCKGQAMDIDMDGSGYVSNRMVFTFILGLDFDQLIWEFGDSLNPDWVHVSYVGAGNRKQVLKAIKSGKTTKYIPY